MIGKHKYYSLSSILKRDAQYNIIFGERSNGKTYACLEYGISNYIKHGKQMAYVRRSKEDFTGRRGATLFDSLIANGVIANLSHGEWTDVYYYSSRWFLCRYDEKNNRITQDTPFAYGFALSTSEHDKSTSYPNVTTIVFDEFITRQYYLADEFTIFANVISTIIRQRTDVKIFMLGNTVNKYSCPYVAEMGLKHFREMKQGDIDVYQYGESKLRVAVEYCKPNKQGKANNYYFAFDNPKLAMITSGEWEIEVYPHCPTKFKPKDIVYHYYIKYIDVVLKCEIVNIDDSLFTFVHPQTTTLSFIEENTALFFCDVVSSKPNYRRRINEPRDLLGRRIYEFYITDKVFYATNETGEVVRNYLMWCEK